MSVESVFDLSPAEKLQLVEDLWDDLATNPNDVPVFDWQKVELARRQENLKSLPESGIEWNKFKSKLRESYER